MNKLIIAHVNEQFVRNNFDLLKEQMWCNNAWLTNACSKSTIETLQKGMKYVQS